MNSTLAQPQKHSDQSGLVPLSKRNPSIMPYRTSSCEGTVQAIMPPITRPRRQRRDNRDITCLREYRWPLPGGPHAALVVHRVLLFRVSRNSIRSVQRSAEADYSRKSDRGQNRAADPKVKCLLYQRIGTILSTAVGTLRCGWRFTIEGFAREDLSFPEPRLCADDKPWSTPRLLYDPDKIWRVCCKCKLRESSLQQIVDPMATRCLVCSVTAMMAVAKSQFAIREAGGAAQQTTLANSGFHLQPGKYLVSLSLSSG